MSLYDPIKVIINQIKTEARVLSLSGIPGVNGLDIFGRQLKPELVQANCPKCNAILKIIIPYDLENEYEMTCQSCIKRVEEIVFFIDPIESNRIGRHELFSTVMTLERIQQLPEDIDRNERESIFGFEESEEPDSLIEKSDLGIAFDDEDLLED